MMLAKALSQYWWLALLRGVVAILFGLAAFMLPGITLSTLFIAFAAYAFVEGLLAVFWAFGARRSDEEWWIVLLEGMIGVAFGVIAFMRPMATSMVLLFYIGAWAMISGGLRVATAIRLRRVIQGEGWLAFGGVVSILFGVLMFAAPEAGALALVYYIGAWAIVSGGTLCGVAYRLRRLEKGDEREVPTLGVHAR
ncbi:MAG TPA: HdeD family acid-resistance protein [Polyangiaceae bacterium]|nr:HdeD family acid-resistance protein [Polyangiaceae bacterium]